MNSTNNLVETTQGQINKRMQKKINFRVKYENHEWINNMVKELEEHK